MVSTLLHGPQAYLLYKVGRDRLSYLGLHIGSFLLSDMFLVLHEIAENLMGRVLDELRRVLKPESVFLIVDKILFEASSPSEELTTIQNRIGRDHCYR